MPKLNAKLKKKVEKAEAVTGEFEPLKAGKYIGTLSEVEAKNSAAGNPMWVAEFTDLENLDGDTQPGRQWYNLNLPTSDTPPDYYEKGEEKWVQYQRMCEGRLKAFFEAFGYTVDTDTDEMVGEQCVLIIGVRTIKTGERAGERTNSVNGVAPLDSVTRSTGDDDEDDDEF